MRYNEPLNLKLYKYENSQFVLQAIIDDYQEISFCHSLYEAGDFTITINYNIPNALKFERGMWVQFGNDSYMFGEIIKITDSIGSDGKGSQIRTIYGKDARYIFKRRIIKNLNNVENWSMTDKGELCLRNLIKDQCGSGAEAKRQLPVTNTIPTSSNALGKEFSVSESFTNLYDVCVTIATQSEIGWRVKFNNGLILECYQGADKENLVQFSTNFDSLANGEIAEGVESYCNTVYVGGKGTGADRDIYEGVAMQDECTMIDNEEERNDLMLDSDEWLVDEGHEPTELERFEAYDNQTQMNTEAEYKAEALSMLTQYGQTLSVSGNGLAQCPYIFKENYDIGDIITVEFSGKKAVAQILTVTEHWVWGQYTLEFTFGKPQNDLNRQLLLMLQQIQKAGGKGTTTSSVKWYTFNDRNITQDKADVIYDTIGITGNAIVTDLRFIVYKDSDNVGSKFYNVYVKNLEGNDVYITGADNTNIRLTTGSYITKIFVDEEGRVIKEG